MRNYLYNKPKIIIAVVEIGIAFLLAAGGALDGFFGGAGFLFAGIFAFFIVANYFAMLGVSVLSVNKNAAIGMRQTVKFGDENIIVVSETGGENIERTVEYSEIRFVRGFAPLYVITTQGGGAFLIDRKGFLGCTPLDFEGFISSHVSGDRVKFSKINEA